MQELLDADGVAQSLQRVASEIAARTGGSTGVMLIGIRRGGVPLASELKRLLAAQGGPDVPLGSVDITFYRDDAATALPNPRIGPSQIEGSLDGRHVILVDDVLFTGRTIRAALDALLDYGRPRRVELAVLVDRGGRELPIQADYVGHRVNVPADRRVDVIERAGRPVAIVQPFGAPSIPPPGASS